MSSSQRLYYGDCHASCLLCQWHEMESSYLRKLEDLQAHHHRLVHMFKFDLPEADCRHIPSIVSDSDTKRNIYTARQHYRSLCTQRSLQGQWMTHCVYQICIILLTVCCQGFFALCCCLQKGRNSSLGAW